MSDRIAQTPIVARPDLAASMRAAIPMWNGIPMQVYMMNGARIIVADEPEGWHISISRHDRDPSWDEIATVRYRLLPEVPTMAMFLPPLSEYVNLDPFTFHLHEDPPRNQPTIWTP